MFTRGTWLKMAWNIGGFCFQHKSGISATSVIAGFKSFCEKWSCSQWELNSQHQASLNLKFNAHPTLPICHSLPVSNCKTLIKSWFFESRNNPSPKSELEHETKFYLRIFCSKHVWVAQWNRHLTSTNPFMVGIVSSITTGGNFIFCWNLYRNFRTARFVFKTKTSILTTKQWELTGFHRWN